MQVKAIADPVGLELRMMRGPMLAHITPFWNARPRVRECSWWLKSSKSPNNWRRSRIGQAKAWVRLVRS